MARTKKAVAPKVIAPKAAAPKPPAPPVVEEKSSVATFEGVKFDLSGIPENDRTFDRASVVRDEKGKAVSVTLVTSNWNKYRLSIDGIVEACPRIVYPEMVKEDPAIRKARADKINAKTR